MHCIGQTIAKSLLGRNRLWQLSNIHSPFRLYVWYGFLTWKSKCAGKFFLNVRMSFLPCSIISSKYDRSHLLLGLRLLISMRTAAQYVGIRWIWVDMCDVNSCVCQFCMRTIWRTPISSLKTFSSLTPTTTSSQDPSDLTPKRFYMSIV